MMKSTCMCRLLGKNRAMVGLAAAQLGTFSEDLLHHAFNSLNVFCRFAFAATAPAKFFFGLRRPKSGMYPAPKAE